MQINLNNIDYTYNKGTVFEKRVLKNVTLKLKERAYNVIVGKTGSGKSTLIEHINGLLVPNSGEVIVDDTIITFPKNKREKKELAKKLREIRKDVAVLFQFSEQQLFETTVLKDIMFAPLNYGVNEKEARKNAIELVKLVGLSEDYLEKSPFELSGGEMRKVALCGILALNPKVLILDEPSANLDMKATFDLFLILEKLKKKGTTVVLIEHRLYYVKSLFDRFLLMKDGEIAQDLSREEVIHLKGTFWDENGLRTLELEEYRISEKKDSYQLNEESISGKGLKFCYPNVAKDGKKKKQYILNHLDFNMEYGKAIGLIGLNGTGKTTFARVISGLEKIEEGKIWAEKDKELNRKDLMDMSYFVFQDSDYQLFSESVLDEMLLGMEGKDKKENTQKAKSILSELGLDKYMDKHPFALSRGEKQRLTIACGMMKRAKVFIYDEPTSGCDKDSMLSVAKLIEEQLKNGTTVLVISHDFEFLANTVSEVAVMGDGKIETVLDMSESNKFLILDKMRGGRELVR